MQSKLIVGLGNPGTEYENTRHNIGFALLDAFGEKYKVIGKQRSKLSCWCGRGKIFTDQYDLILAWPTTFMNQSGESISKLLKWLKLKPKELIVVHDDVSLNLGKIRISFNSSAGGHHGVESIIQHINSQEFIRLRIGIGPDPGGDKRKDHVLDKFKKDEAGLVKKVIDVSIQALETIITKDVGETMNKFNGIEVTQGSKDAPPGRLNKERTQ